MIHLLSILIRFAIPIGFTCRRVKIYHPVERSELKRIVESIPSKPGVYMFRKGDAVLYVGKARNLRNRLMNYTQYSSNNPRINEMVDEADSLDYIVTRNEKEALLLELSLVHHHDPPFNIRLKGKPYPYIGITKERIPRITLIRTRDSEKYHHFGPFVSPSQARHLVSIVRQVFGLRNCGLRLPSRKTHRPCIEYHIGRCSAPCAGLIDEEEYRKRVDMALRFLSGKTSEVEEYIRREIDRAVKELKFERAKSLRDALRSIMSYTARQSVWGNDEYSKDYIGVASAGDTIAVSRLLWRDGRVVGRENYIMEKAHLEEPMERFLAENYLNAGGFIDVVVVDFPVDDEFRKLLPVKVRQYTPSEYRLREIARQNAEEHLKQYMVHLSHKRSHPGLKELEKLFGRVGIRHIEGIDISHFSGEGVVGSVVVFIDGKPARSHYRRYRIKSLAEGEIDDYRSIEEVVFRRYRRILEERKELPDLVLIDGGPGQLRAALKSADKLGIRDRVLFVGLAKRLEEIVLESGEKIILPGSSWALRLLQHVRNEAHRFALSYQRKLRERKIRSSILDAVEGLGEKKRKELLRYFGSVDRIKSASVEELMKVPGIGEKLARRIKEILS